MIEQKQVVGVILLDTQGRVLLQQRDDKPDLRYAGYWTFFGGAVEEGETPDEAIKRELIEELELTDIDLQFWMSYVCPARTIPDQLETTNFMYVGKLTVDVNTLTLHEGQAMRLYTLDEAKQLILAFEQSPILAQFIEEKE